MSSVEFLLTVLLLGVVTRIALAYKDGMSNRAKAPNGKLVNWIDWHVVGWIGRDGVLAYFHLRALNCFELSWIGFGLISLILLAGHKWLHEYFYELARKQRDWHTKEWQSLNTLSVWISNAKAWLRRLNQRFGIWD